MFDYIWRYELNWLGFKYLPIGLAPMGLAPPIRLTPIGLTALALCLLGNDISIWRIWDPIGSCDRQSQLGIIPPLIENFYWRTCWGHNLEMLVLTLEWKNCYPFPFRFFLVVDEIPNQRRGTNGIKPSRSKVSWFVLINPKQGEEVIRWLLILELFKPIQKVKTSP